MNYHGLKLLPHGPGYKGRIHRYEGCPKLKSMSEYKIKYVGTRTVKDLRKRCMNCFPTTLFREIKDFYC